MKNLLIVIICLVSVVSVFAGWEYTQPIKPVVDLIEYLIPVPRAVLNNYGHTDRTVVLWNLGRLKEVCQGYEVRIKALEDRIAELMIVADEMVIDVNDPNQ